MRNFPFLTHLRWSWNEASRRARGERSGYLQGGGLAVQRLDVDMENSKNPFKGWLTLEGRLKEATPCLICVFWVEWIATRCCFFFLLRCVSRGIKGNREELRRNRKNYWERMGQLAFIASEEMCATKILAVPFGSIAPRSDMDHGAIFGFCQFLSMICGK